LYQSKHFIFKAAGMVLITPGLLGLLTDDGEGLLFSKGSTVAGIGSEIEYRLPLPKDYYWSVDASLFATKQLSGDAEGGDDGATGGTFNFGLSRNF